MSEETTKEVEATVGEILCWLLDPSAKFFGIGDVIFVRQ
jgi:hypothetical protein